MYRITPLVTVFLMTACAIPNTQLRDQPHIERLRMQISKARNAIAETRAAIALARGAPYLAELYVRLAELLSDEGRYHYQVAYEREQRSGKSLHAPQVRFLKDQAIGIYTEVLKNYPTTQLAPRILFNMGQEHRELGNYKKMRAALERLVKEYPRSKLRSEALLILGDDRFDRSELAQAGSYYSQMLTGPLSRMTGLGHYKYAWVLVNQANCKQAVVHFKRAITKSEAWFTRPNMKESTAATQSELDVRREALVDMVYCYTQEKKDEGAVELLKSMAYSRSAYVAALERLADRLGTLDAANGALRAGRELLVLATDAPNRVDDARMLYAAIIKSKNYKHVGSDVDLIVRAIMRQVRKPTGAQETRDRLLSELEKMVGNLALLAQKKLQTLAKDSDSRRVMGLQVARAYAVHVRTFPESDQKTAMLSNLVDVLTESKSVFNAGRRAIELAERLSAGNLQDEAWYDALVNLQATLRGKSTRMQRVVARAGLRKAGQALLARTLPVDRARKVKFAVAQTDYDEGRYRSAIDRLNAIAFEYPGTKEGNTAVHLVLDSYRTANDYLGLIRAGHRFMAASSPVQSKIKAEIKPIVKSAEQQQLDELALAAAGVDGGDVTGDLEKFAKAYAGTALGERAVINALLAARASGDSKTLYRLAGEFEKKYPKSLQLSAIRATIARTAASRFELDQAVTFFVKSAEGKGAQKGPLLIAAGNLKAQLADVDGAKEAFKAALSAADTTAAKNQAVQPLVKLLERQGQYDAVITTIGKLGEEADPNTLAYLGIAQIRKGKGDEGEATLQKVLDGGPSASTEARARAYFGQAEVFNKALLGFNPGGDLETIQELVTLLEVTEQAYLKAAREGSALYTAAAFARLAFVSETTAKRMREIKLPPGVDQKLGVALKTGFSRRADRLDRQAKEAVAGCAEQGWIHHNFNAAVRVCLTGKIPPNNPITFSPLKPRRPSKGSPKLEALRVRLSKNPEDLDALRSIGEDFLTNGDFHAARLVFDRASQVGGGPLEANLLGIASFKAGDIAGGLNAFARAASGGLSVARDNLAAALRSVGLTSAAADALKRFTGGRPGGRKLNGAGG